MMLTPNEVVQNLVAISHELDKKTAEIAALDEAAVRAKAAYQVGYARAFLTAEGAVDVRKQTAVIKCEVLWLEMELAEQKLRAARESIRTLRDRLDVGRSIGTAARAEAAAAGYQP